MSLSSRIDNIPVTIEDFNPEWERMFILEKQNLEAVMQNARIEHFGSTAVKGLEAKPVIDILFGVDDYKKINVTNFLNLGYEYLPELEKSVSSRLFFVKYENNKMKYTLHIVNKTSKYFIEKLVFRDILRKNPEVVKQYTNLKHNLAKIFKNKRHHYAEAKTEFIQSIIKKAELL